MLAAAALTLTLQLAPAVDDQAATTHVPLSLLAEGPARPKLRSWTWIPAGGYGLAAFGAGVGAMFANNDRGVSPNARKANVAMGIGALAGLLPGLLLGNEARYEQSEKTRAYIPVVDVLGSLAAVVGYVVTH
jgi:hypothetical protein